MVLNYIWIGLIIIGFIVGLIKFIVFGEVEIFSKLIFSTYEQSKTAVDISIYLIGVMTLWLGIMNVGEKGGAIGVLSRLVAPFFTRIFPELPKNHPAFGSILMNFSANMLGLDNAATPLGLKAMNDLQSINPKKDTASNAQIMFIVLNTSGLTLIPISIMAIRAANGAVNPTDVFIPILFATYFSTLVGLISVSIVQRINLFNKVIMAYLLGVTAVIAAIIYYFSQLERQQAEQIAGIAGNFIIFAIIISFIALAIRKKVNAYEAFIEGAKSGFTIAVRIIPFLLAILIAVGIFRTSGAMGFLMSNIESFFAFLGFDTQFVGALPTALMKPLSGGGARGMMIEAIEHHGVDSFQARLAATFQGSTETTFYTLAVYFGSVAIKRVRYSLTCGLLADLAGFIAAIFIAYLFFA